MNLKAILTIILTLTSIWAQAEFKVATYNIRNFDYDPRYNIHTNKPHLKNTIASIKADLFAVQEIVQDRVFTQFIESEFSQYSVVLTECGGQNDQKLGFVYNNKRLQLKNFIEDMRVASSRPGQEPKCDVGSRPALIANFYDKVDKINFTAVAVHLKAGGEPSDIQKRFYQVEVLTKLIKELKNKGEDNFIIMGDFNTTEYIQQTEEYDRFVKSFKNIQMDDLSTKVSCTSYWFGGIDDGLEYPSILDHIIVSPYFKNSGVKVEVEAHCKKTKCGVADHETLGVSFTEVSDHCPLTATF